MVKLDGKQKAKTSPILISPDKDNLSVDLKKKTNENTEQII